MEKLGLVFLFFYFVTGGRFCPFRKAFCSPHLLLHVYLIIGFQHLPLSLLLVHHCSFFFNICLRLVSGIAASFREFVKEMVFSEEVDNSRSSQNKFEIDTF